MTILSNAENWQSIKNECIRTGNTKVITSRELIDMIVKDNDKNIYYSQDYLRVKSLIMQTADILLTDIPDMDWNQYHIKEADYDIPTWVYNGLTINGKQRYFAIAPSVKTIRVKSFSPTELIAHIKSMIKAWSSTHRIDIPEVMQRVTSAI